jgi:hypothetical protein
LALLEAQATTPDEVGVLALRHKLAVNWNLFARRFLDAT